MVFLIGRKLTHSYSVMIHEMFGKYEYKNAELEPDQLDSFMRSGEWDALNVTIPYKIEVMKYCDEISQQAQDIGSVNTVVRRDGKIYGYNTDYFGLAACLERHGIDCKGKKVLVLGSGGTSKVARCVASDMGASSVTVISRSGEDNYENISRHRDAGVIINTTPVGMFPDNGQKPLSLSGFDNLSGVADVIFNPLRSSLVLEAGELGIPCCGGLYMLVIQAAYACSHFCSYFPEKEETEKVYRRLLARVGNIVLVGMPGAGKSTLGRLVAGYTGRPFFDTDEEIVLSEKRSIPDIFASSGERFFRAIEKETVKRLCAMGGRVISTGGGVPLSHENCDFLRQNGRVYYIRRPTELLERDGRPLSSGNLEEMLRMRDSYYRNASDVVVENDKEPEEAAKKIAEDYYENFCD